MYGAILSIAASCPITNVFQLDATSSISITICGTTLANDPGQETASCRIFVLFSTVPIATFSLSNQRRLGTGKFVEEKKSKHTGGGTMLNLKDVSIRRKPEQPVLRTPPAKLVFFKCGVLFRVVTDHL